MCIVYVVLCSSHSLRLGWFYRVAWCAALSCWDFRWKLTRNSCVKMIVWFWILGNWPPADQNPLFSFAPACEIEKFQTVQHTTRLFCFFFLKKRWWVMLFRMCLCSTLKGFPVFWPFSFILSFFLSTGKVKKETWHVFQQACYAWPSLLL